jgi:RNA polymerase sigma factor (sigma-70 family)
VSTTTAATTHRTTELVRNARTGDTWAIEQLIDRYESVVWSTVRSFCMSEADARDAVQNTWLRMIEHLGELRDPDQLPGWLATTARHECLNILITGERLIAEVDPALYERPDAATPGDTEPHSYLNTDRNAGMPIGSAGVRRMRRQRRLRQPLECFSREMIPMKHREFGGRLGSRGYHPAADVANQHVEGHVRATALLSARFPCFTPTGGLTACSGPDSRSKTSAGRAARPHTAGSRRRTRRWSMPWSAPTSTGVTRRSPTHRVS